MTIHGDQPCNCYDDAELHEYLRARDLIAAGREDEITGDGREALRNHWFQRVTDMQEWTVNPPF